MFPGRLKSVDNWAGSEFSGSRLATSAAPMMLHPESFCRFPESVKSAGVAGAAPCDPRAVSACSSARVAQLHVLFAGRVRAMLAVFLVLFVCVCCQSQTVNEKKIRIDGDIILGGLFPMHEAGAGDKRCGPIKEEKGIQRVEAMLYALETINNNTSILPNVRLGAVIMDTCSRDTYALEQAMDFVKSSLTFDLSEITCEDGRTPKTSARKPASAVIGAASSTASVMVANILRLFQVPQVSYASTSTELSDKYRFEFFSRVVPPDNFQAQAMVDVIKQLGWTYVSTVADEGDYGERGILSFIKQAEKAGICIATNEKIVRNAQKEHFKQIVQNLTKHNLARAVVLFVDEDNCRTLLETVVDSGYAGHFYWVGSDSWGAKIHPVKEERVQKAAEGAITILPKRTPLEGFDKYFRILRPTNNKKNVWFQEFWEQHFNCSLKNNTCKETDFLRYKQEGLVPFVVDAVYAVAYALHSMLSDKCKGQKTLFCDAVKPKPDGTELLSYIRNVSFIGMQQRPVRFNKDGDAYGMYDIYQFQKKNESHDYKRIGEWNDRWSKYNKLSLNLSLMQWANYTRGEIARSVCSDPCENGSIRLYQGNRCCWKCTPCRAEEFIFNETCIACPDGEAPLANKSGCYKLPIEYIAWSSPWAFVPLIFSSVGILFILFILAVFIHYSNTPIIMASGRELSYVLLTGILSCYATSFIVVTKPTIFTCTLFRFCLGVCFCTCYSAILTKTNRISRIFNRGIKSIKRPSYTSPRSQLIICFTMIGIQMIGSMAWLMIEQPRTREIYPSRFVVVLQCGASSVTKMISLIYNMVLIVLCTIYAFKTRKIPENFNEAKYIAFTMYSTCILWLAFVPIYFGTNHDYKVQTAITCMFLNINATIALSCMFVPKVYVVLFQPYKNVRQAGSHSSGATHRSRFQVSKSSGETNFPGLRPTHTNGDLATTPSVDESSVD